VRVRENDHKLVQYRPTILGNDIDEATGRRTEKGMRVTCDQARKKRDQLIVCSIERDAYFPAKGKRARAPDG